MFLASLSCLFKKERSSPMPRICFVLLFLSLLLRLHRHSLTLLYSPYLSSGFDFRSFLCDIQNTFPYSVFQCSHHIPWISITSLAIRIPIFLLLLCNTIFIDRLYLLRPSLLSPVSRHLLFKVVHDLIPCSIYPHPSPYPLLFMEAGDDTIFYHIYPYDQPSVAFRLGSLAV
ncbi:hypothetical protein BDQ17DRAFT_789390 [Cyathus striatus]|nr:hypothetical protein BDQ17DRAFT_789390 [Cyathus striatus]